MFEAFPLEPEKLAEMIDIPLDKWPGNCHGVASAVLKLVPVKGMKLCRGHWHGYISKNSVYRSQGIQQHSWLELEDGRILDPTRWAMEEPDSPSIYLGINDCYDEYGAMLKQKSYYPSLGKVEYPFISNIKSMNVEQFKTVFPDSIMPKTDDGWYYLTENLHSRLKEPPEHHQNCRDLYQVLQDIGMKAFIQIDMWNSVMEPHLVYARNDANRYFSVPEPYEMTDTKKLFLIFNRFLCIEDRDNIEEELDELGYELERDLWGSLNTMEHYLDVALEDLPNIDHMIDNLSVISGDLLGRGYGKELEVERFAKSLGWSRHDLKEKLESFGNRCGYCLSWSI